MTKNLLLFSSRNSTTRGWSKLYNLCPNPSDSSDDTSMYNVSVPSTLCTEDSSIATNLSILTERTKEAGFTDNLSYDPDFNETYVPQVDLQIEIEVILINTELTLSLSLSLSLSATMYRVHVRNKQTKTQKTRISCLSLCLSLF